MRWQQRGKRQIRSADENNTKMALVRSTSEHSWAHENKQQQMEKMHLAQVMSQCWSENSSSLAETSFPVRAQQLDVTRY